MRRTKEDALETRERILDAAEAVFHRDGVSQTTLADVAAEAGVTRGAIYHHFTDKAELFDAMMQRLFDPVEQQIATLEAEIASRGSTLENLRIQILGYVQRLEADERFRRVLETAWHKCEYVGAMARIRDQHQECGSRYLHLIEAALRVARDQGAIRADSDPRQAAVGLMAIVDGLIVNWTLDPQRFPLGRDAEGVVDIYLRGLQQA